MLGLQLNFNFTVFVSLNKTTTRLGLEITAPRSRKPPARYTGPATAFQTASAEEHYRALYYVILDNASQQLRDRFDSTAPGLSRYLKLEGMLLGGLVDSAVVKQYPELDETNLVIQLAMFRNQYAFTTVEQARVHMRGMCS